MHSPFWRKETNRIQNIHCILTTGTRMLFIGLNSEVVKLWICQVSRLFDSFGDNRRRQWLTDNDNHREDHQSAMAYADKGVTFTTPLTQPFMEWTRPGTKISAASYGNDTHCGRSAPIGAWQEWKSAKWELTGEKGGLAMRMMCSPSAFNDGENVKIWADVYAGCSCSPPFLSWMLLNMQNSCLESFRRLEGRVAGLMCGMAQSWGKNKPDGCWKFFYSFLHVPLSGRERQWIRPGWNWTDGGGRTRKRMLVGCWSEFQFIFQEKREG